jgi:hypothetical protein
LGDRLGNLSYGRQLLTSVRDETAALTKHAAKVEREIDARLAGLYGLRGQLCRSSGQEVLR